MKNFLLCIIMLCVASCAGPLVVQPVHHPFDRPVPHIVVPSPAPHVHFFGTSYDYYQWKYPFLMKTDSIKTDTVKVDSIK